MPPDFSSPEYWTKRFEQETKTGGYEWLLPSSNVLPLVKETFEAWLKSTYGLINLNTENQEGQIVEPSQKRLEEESELKEVEYNVLHFGCGTSKLGENVRKALTKAFESFDKPQKRWKGPKIKVIDSDYVADSLNVTFPDYKPHCESILHLNVLNISELVLKSPKKGWDLILDKSTADAISCGPDLHYIPPSGFRGGGDGKEVIKPIIRLCENLAKVTQVGGRWICISYSFSRFDHLKEDFGVKGRDGGWRIFEKRLVMTTNIPSGRVVKDGMGKRVVYEPETGIYGYVLERI